MMEWFGADLNMVQSYICTENRCCILRQNPSVEHLFSELYTMPEPRETGYLRLKTVELLLFLSRLDAQKELQQTEYFNRHQVECARRAAGYISHDLTEHYTIEQLAAKVNLSPTALKKNFRGVYGTSLYAYLRRCRLQAAQKLLLETEAPIAEIAHRVGYENPNKFSSAFRQVYAMTPMEYRKMCRNG